VCPDPAGITAHADHDWPALAGAAVERAIKAMDSFDLPAAGAAAIDLSKCVDGYIHGTEPFKLAKDPANMPKVGTILYHAAEALRITAILMSAAAPMKMADLLRRFGQEAPDDKGGFTTPLAELCRWGGLKPGTRIVKGEALFPRADPAAAAPGATSA
jgi:methionyl-tRNA synthetase